MNFQDEADEVLSGELRGFAAQRSPKPPAFFFRARRKGEAVELVESCRPGEPDNGEEAM